VADAHDHLDAVADLFLDEEFGGLLGEAGLGEAVPDRGDGVGGRLRGADAEGDAADVAFVDGGGDLDRDRAAEFGLAAAASAGVRTSRDRAVGMP
jgi:hypothetical protein